jgi:hypothetical protein
MRVSTRRLIRGLDWMGSKWSAEELQNEMSASERRISVHLLRHFRRKLARARALRSSVEYERILADLDDAIKELSR